MLRLIGLVVVVLLVLSLAHGERTGSAYDRMNAKADTLIDTFTGAMADGVQTLGDIVFGPRDRDERGGPARDLTRNFEGMARSADGASRRALAQMVLRSCPSLGLVCQPAPGGGLDEGQPTRRLPQGDQP